MAEALKNSIAVVGIDIGKNSFHVVGLDERGAKDTSAPLKPSPVPLAPNQNAISSSCD